MIIKKTSAEIVYCNRCGQAINKDFDYTDSLEVKKEWGYFSNKDLQIHSFVLCEHCYDELIKEFKIPINIKINNEAI